MIVFTISSSVSGQISSMWYSLLGKSHTKNMKELFYMWLIIISKTQVYPITLIVDELIWLT